MELSVKDRLYLPSFLPARGNFKDFNLKKEILRKIAIPDEERKAIGLHENAEDKRIEWDVEKEKPLAVEFSGTRWSISGKPANASRTRSFRTICGLPCRASTISFRRSKPSFLSAGYSFEKSARSYSDVWSGFLLKYRSWQDRT